MPVIYETIAYQEFEPPFEIKYKLIEHGVCAIYKRPEYSKVIADGVTLEELEVLKQLLPKDEGENHGYPYPTDTTKRVRRNQS